MGSPSGVIPNIMLQMELPVPSLSLEHEGAIGTRLQVTPVVTRCFSMVDAGANPTFSTQPASAAYIESTAWITAVSEKSADHSMCSRPYGERARKFL